MLATYHSHSLYCRAALFFCSSVDIRDAVLGNLDEGKSETYFAATHTDAATGALTVVGAVHLKWGVRKDDTPGVITVHGTFSVVAVGTAYRERGFGKYLIRSVESFLLSEAKRAAESAAELAARSTQQAAAERVRCESGALVLDVRTELPPWYARQGYATVETGLPFPYPEMLNEQYSNVTGMRILKVLSEDVAATA